MRSAADLFSDTLQLATASWVPTPVEAIVAKLNPRRPRRADGPISATVPAITHEGGPAFSRDAKSDLFLLAVTNMVGEDTFYEQAGTRDARFRQLVREIAVSDPEWLTNMIRWLRSGANMRSASIVAAAEMAKARSDANAAGSTRAAVDAAIQRADEPGDLLAYWTANYGRAIPKPVKRGVADAVRRLYTERSLLRYDTDSKGFRFGDVIDLCHPTPTAPWQDALFKYALDRRHGGSDSDLAALPRLRAHANVMAIPVGERRAFLRESGAVQQLEAAGITWEALSGWLQGPMDAEAWEAIIPSMGYMALLRNLRNFDEAGIGQERVAFVCTRLADRGEVFRSRQFPYRFLSAYLNVPSQRWAQALETALGHSVGNLPPLGGSTLVLVDTSASMNDPLSARSTATRVQAGALFGAALACRGEHVDLVGFATGAFTHRVRTGSSVLKVTDEFRRRVGEVGHGTQIHDSLRATYRGHDRVVIVSDMQTFPPGHRNSAHDLITDIVGEKTYVYAFNLGGYDTGVVDTAVSRHYEMGGLTDATFKMITLLEQGRDAGWPWEQEKPGSLDLA